MKDYYQYFVNKGNHPDKNDILKQEEYQFKTFNQNIARQIIQQIIEVAKEYNKPFASRIIYKEKVIAMYNELENISWLSRKEKVCHETKHSSYYIFLDNMQSHLYDYMINDESYGICGGSFPLYEKDEFVGSITFTGLRPQEDHGVIIQALEKIFQEEN